MQSIIVPLALGVACVCWTRNHRALRGTTLVAPWRWGWVALAALGSAELARQLIAWTPHGWDACRYVVATATFCPLMAVLGAKRPQDTGWQWIVLSFWGVLILPVLEMAMLWHGGEIDDGPMRRWLLLILLSLGLSNYLLTRYVWAIVLAVAGQTLLLNRHLPFVITQHDQLVWPLGVALLSAATVAMQLARGSNQTGTQRVWTDFRDAFGLVWSVRVMERINTTASLRGWTSRLGWFGLRGVDPDVALPELATSTETDTADDLEDTGSDAAGSQRADEQSAEQQQREMVVAFRTLLRRFVSNDWIDQRVAGP